MIPANIASELAFLQAQVTAAAPLANASRATIIAIQLNAQQLVNDLDSAETSTAGTLDTWVAPVFTPSIVAGILSLMGNAFDQSNVAIARGYIGRATTNVDQLV